MVHCRTPFGAWKHANRSYKRGYAARPPGFFGGDLLPPPAPPISFGEEFSGNRHSDWNVLCDEEEWGTLERNCPTETICPTGVVTDYLELLDAPITAKDISWPQVLCLIDLLDQESAEPESETVAAKPLASLEDFLELPSTNGYIGQVVEELTVKLENLHTECKKELAGMEDRITAALMEKFSSPDVELVKPLAGLCLPACPSLQPPLDPHQFSFAERRQMFSSVVASTLEAEEQHCNSNIGKSAYGCDLPGRALLRPFEENPIDIDSIGTILQDLQSLRVYCFPFSKPKPFVWNADAKKFILPLPEDAENYANCTVDFYSHLLEHTEANRIADIRATFDEAGEDCLAELSCAQVRLNNSKYTNRRVGDDPKPLLCKIMNLIEFVPQNHLKHFAMCLRVDLSCMNEQNDKTFKVVYSDQQHMKMYSFVRNSLPPSRLGLVTDSDFDDSEDSYERNSNACIAYWHNQEDKLPDSENSNARF